MSDHSAIGSLVAVGDLQDVVGYRGAVACLKVQMTVADDSEAWNRTWDGGSAYEKLVDFQRRHHRRVRICSRSMSWWDAELSGQIRAVWRTRRN